MSDELVDLKIAAENNCHKTDTASPNCEAPILAYKACVMRIGTTPGKHCTGQYLDYLKCIDQCATKSYFNKLK